MSRRTNLDGDRFRNKDHRRRIKVLLIAFPINLGTARVLGPAAGGSGVPPWRRSSGNINRHVTTRPRGIPITAPFRFLSPLFFSFLFFSFYYFPLSSPFSTALSCLPGGGWKGRSLGALPGGCCVCRYSSQTCLGSRLPDF